MPRYKIRRAFWDGEILRPKGSTIFLPKETAPPRTAELWDVDEKDTEAETPLEDLSYNDLLKRAGDLDLDLSEDKSREDLVRRIKSAEAKQGTVAQAGADFDEPDTNPTGVNDKGQTLSNMSKEDAKRKGVKL